VKGFFMETSGDNYRSAPRERCRGEVLVYLSQGGAPFRGGMIDLGGGGARLELPLPLPKGEVVRLILPGTGKDARRAGKILIGKVVHMRSEAGRHVVGISFVRNGEQDEGRPTIFRHGPSALIARLFSWGARRTAARRSPENVGPCPPREGKRGTVKPTNS
jgi:hypothetical protein